MSHLADATDYVVQLQKLLKATEAALDTADKLKTSSNRWFRAFKPVLTARAHYKEALNVYAVAIEMITPCIDAMDPEDALAFLNMASELLDLRKTIYENNSYNKKLCVKLLEDSRVLRENAGRSKHDVELKQLKHKIRLTTINDASQAGTRALSSATHSTATTSGTVLGCAAASSRDPFLDPRDPAAMTNPDTSGLFAQVSF